MLNKNDLIAYLASGAKPREKWRIGLEHEQFLMNAKSELPLAYDSNPGVRQLLEAFAERYSWKPKYEGENVIALSRDGASITLEPAGQFELSGAPYVKIEDMAEEHRVFTQELQSLTNELGISCKSIGIHPEWTRDDIHWMPKARYKIMREYLPTRGSLGIDMMTRTSGAQVNLDFGSETDMVDKYRIATAMQPFMIAFFANSKIVEGKDSGYVSYRAHIWSDTDPDRCGVPAFIFDDDMGFERYVDYMLDVPMFFIIRDGEMIDMAGKSFRKFINGDLPENNTYVPNLQDWEDHLSTAFPEVRLKKYLELRGPDSVAAPLLYSLAAFWVGLLYDVQTLNKAKDIISNWDIKDHLIFREAVTREGMRTNMPKSKNTIGSFAPKLIDLAREGLQSQYQQSSALIYLDLLESHIQNK